MVEITNDMEQKQLKKIDIIFGWDDKCTPIQVVEKSIKKTMRCAENQSSTYCQ